MTAGEVRNVVGGAFGRGHERLVPGDMVHRARVSGSMRADTGTSRARWTVQGLLRRACGDLTEREHPGVTQAPSVVRVWHTLFETDRMCPQRHVS